jgi:hypothetical protein
MSKFGTFETSRDVRSVVALGGKADIAKRWLQAPLQHDPKDPSRTRAAR